MTAPGFAKLEAELKNLKTVERPAVIKAIAEARAHGDLSENAEYHAAREKQSFIEGRVQDLEDVISRVEVFDISEMAGDTVKFGASVELIDEESEEKAHYQIVGDYEADITQHRISISSPLARALIGRKKGDSVEVSTPKGMRYYEILSISYR